MLNVLQSVKRRLHSLVHNWATFSLYIYSYIIFGIITNVYIYHLYIQIYISH